MTVGLQIVKISSEIFHSLFNQQKEVKFQLSYAKFMAIYHNHTPAHVGISMALLACLLNYIHVSESTVVLFM